MINTDQNGLIPLICERCGGKIDRRTMRCEYCDTEYVHKKDSVTVNYVVERPDVHKLRAEVSIPDEMALCNPEGATEFVLARMREQIADGLLAYMKIQTAENPFMCCKVIRGEVRVINPTFR